jgi:hypothetical protein
MSARRSTLYFAVRTPWFPALYPARIQPSGAHSGPSSLVSTLAWKEDSASRVRSSAWPIFRTLPTIDLPGKAPRRLAAPNPTSSSPPSCRRPGEQTSPLRALLLRPLGWRQGRGCAESKRRPAHQPRCEQGRIATSFLCSSLISDESLPLKRFCTS